MASNSSDGPTGLKLAVGICLLDCILQVPYRLAVACLNVLSNRQLSVSLPPGPAGQFIGITNGQYALQLLLQLVSEGVADRAYTSGPSKLGASLGQQLQHSGFLDILPQVLTDAAGSLHATAATEAASRGEPCQRDDAAQSGDRGHGAMGQAGTGSGAESTSTASKAGVSSSSSSSREACGISIASRHRNSIQMHPEETFTQTDAAATVLKLFICISTCWPQHAFVRQVTPACSAPTMRLVVEVLQHSSQHLSSDTAAEPNSPENHAEAWRAASEAAVLVLTGLETDSLAEEQDPTASRLPPHLEALVNSPHLLPCLCLTMLTSAYSTLLLQLPALPSASTQSGQCCSSSRTTECIPDAPKADDNSSSSSSRRKKGTSSKSSSVIRQSRQAAPPTMASFISNSMQAWQFACSQHQLLPASHDKLLHLLGSSSRVLLWGAAAGASNAVNDNSRRGMQPNDAASQLLRLHHYRLLQSVMLYQDLAIRQSADRSDGRLAVQSLLDLKAKLLGSLDCSTEQLGVSLGVAATEQDRRWPLEQQLRYLIPTVLLYWAVNMLATMPNSPNLVDCADVLYSCFIACNVAHVGLERKRERGKLLISQLSKRLSAAEQQSLQAVLQHTASATPPACYVPQDVQLLLHHELLPLAAQAAKQLLAQANSKLAGSNTSATASGDSRQSRTGSMQPTAVFSRDVCQSALVVIKLLSNLNGHILCIAEQRNSQSEGMASTAAGSALYLCSAGC